MRRFSRLSAILLAGICASCGGGTEAPDPFPPVATSQANTPPVIISGSTMSVDENAQGVIFILEAEDSDGAIARRSMLDSGDAALFDFDAETGEVSLDQYLIFDDPRDLNRDNVYDLSFEVADDDGATAERAVAITITEAQLKAFLPPSDNFELIDWRLELPVNEAGELEGDSHTIQEVDLADGYESDYFYTGPDGGMVFRSPTVGATTSENTIFVRTELRGMLRRGDTSIRARPRDDIPNANNWAFSSQPAEAQIDAGGIDGTLRVSLAVNAVSENGSNSRRGRIIIGQIHAKDDEPIRVYYRKLPGNERGVVYAEHEISGGDDIRFDIVGDSSNDAPNPENGFLLDERFSFEIIANGNMLICNVYDENNILRGSTEIDMTNSGYDVLDDWMFFKAGLYHVSDANPSEMGQVTIYELSNSHNGYPF